MSGFSDSEKDKPIRPIFKILAVLLAVIFIPFSLIYVVAGIDEMINAKPFFINKTFLLGSLWLMWGLFFIKSAFKKEKRENKKTLLQGENPSRFALAWEIIAYILSSLVIYLLFKYTPMYSGAWSFAIPLLIGTVFRYFLVTTSLLMQEGYNPYLCLTIVFPLFLMLKVAIRNR